MSERDHIAELEAEIEELSEAVERSRKLSFAAQGLMIGGCLLLVLTVFRLPELGSGALAVSLGAVLGGIALYGSNKRTRDDLLALIRSKEEQRAALINLMRLETVSSG